MLSFKLRLQLNGFNTAPFRSVFFRKIKQCRRVNGGRRMHDKFRAKTEQK